MTVPFRTDAIARAGWLPGPPEFAREPTNCISPERIDLNHALSTTTAGRTLEGEFLISDGARGGSGQTHRMLASRARRPLDGGELFERVIPI
jgi:hypothetical protein